MHLAEELREATGKVSMVFSLKVKLIDVSL